VFTVREAFNAVRTEQFEEVTHCYVEAFGSAVLVYLQRPYGTAVVDEPLTQR
jgi:hypothetical protein